MNDATSVSQTTDTRWRWTRVHLETEGVLAEQNGPLVVIDGSDDVVKVPMAEARALVHDIAEAVAEGSTMRELRTEAVQLGTTPSALWAKYAHLLAGAEL